MRILFIVKFFSLFLECSNVFLYCLWPSVTHSNKKFSHSKKRKKPEQSTIASLVVLLTQFSCKVVFHDPNFYCQHSGKSLLLWRHFLRPHVCNFHLSCSIAERKFALARQQPLIKSTARINQQLTADHHQKQPSCAHARLQTIFRTTTNILNKQWVVGIYVLTYLRIWRHILLVFLSCSIGASDGTLSTLMMLLYLCSSHKQQYISRSTRRRDGRLGRNFTLIYPIF